MILFSFIFFLGEWGLTAYLWDIGTTQPLYNMIRYNTVLYLTQFKDGSQKCIDYIEK